MLCEHLGKQESMVRFAVKFMVAYYFLLWMNSLFQAPSFKLLLGQQYL